MGAGRGNGSSPVTSPDTLGLLSQPFSVATWMVTEQWVALGTKHRTGEVHAGRGTHVRLREQGTRHPEGHANREGPCRSKDATTYSSDEAQWSEKKKATVEPRRTARPRPAHGVLHCSAATGAVQTPTGTRTHRHQHRRTGALGFRHNMDLRLGRQVPLEGAGRRNTCSF